MSALADRSAATGLTLAPTPKAGHATIATGACFPIAAPGQRARRMTISVAGVEGWQRPPLVQYIEAELNQLLELRAGWDGRRARPVTLAAVKSTVRVIDSLMNDGSAPPQLFPLPDGGVQIEWHVGGNSIEVEIDGGGEAHVLAQGSAGDIVAEGMIAPGEGGAQLLAARGFLQALSARLAHASTHA